MCDAAAASAAGGGGDGAGDEGGATERRRERAAEDAANLRGESSDRVRLFGLPPPPLIFTHFDLMRFFRPSVRIEREESLRSAEKGGCRSSCFESGASAPANNF